MRLLVLMGLLALPLAAQDGAVLRTSGTGEITLAPDWAIVTLGVSHRAATAAEASRGTSHVVSQVWDALARAGVPRDSVRTLSSGVQPVIDYQQDRRVTGYVAQTTLHVPVRDLARLGQVIDGALAAGATELHGVQPRSTREDAVRAEVLAQAVRAARADAEALAAAAGGRVGPLIELSTTGSDGPRPMVMAMRAERDAGPALQDIVIGVAVQGVWRFVRGRP